MPSAGEPGGEPQKQDCGAAEGKEGSLHIHMEGGGVVCGAVELKPFGPWSRLEADCLCLCLYWAGQRELRRLGVHLGSLICRRFGTGPFSVDLNRTRSSTLDRWPRPCCTEGDKCRSNANQTLSAAVSSSDFDLDAPTAPVPCVLWPCVLFPKQIVKPEPEFSEDGKARQGEGVKVRPRGEGVEGRPARRQA